MLPIRTFDALYHVGTMKIDDRGTYSLEGDTLSVSIHPKEWTQIARLGGRPTWRLTHPNGIRMLDAFAYARQAREAIIPWAVAQGLAVVGTTYGVPMTDEDGHIGFMHHNTRDEAITEAVLSQDATKDTVPPVHVHTIQDATRLFEAGTSVILDSTALLGVPEACARHRIPTNGDTLEYMGILHAHHHHPGILDGAWWNNMLDV